jgi:hypothetical protein
MGRRSAAGNGVAARNPDIGKKRRNLYPRALLRDVHSQPGELCHGKVGLYFDHGGNCGVWIDICAREVSGHPMDQRVLPGVEPLDTRKAVSQRLEGFEGGP